jgi:hypothetical protein
MDRLSRTDDFHEPISIAIETLAAFENAASKSRQRLHVGGQAMLLKLIQSYAK